MSSDAAAAIIDAAQGARCVMLIGDVDTGKTTIAAALARAGRDAGRRVAVLDTDLGQSEIGPPCTMGLGFVDAEFRRLSDGRLTGLAFIGSTSPVGFTVQCAAAARRLADRAWERGAELLIVDTSGWVRGYGARALKLAKADLLQPDRILMLQRGRELDGLARGLPADAVLRLDASPHALVKTRAVRVLRRETRLGAYFSGGRELEFRLPHLRLRGTLLGSGRVLTREALARLQPGLSAPLEYGERADGGFLFVLDGRPTSQDALLLRQRVHAPVHLSDGTHWPGVLLGLLDRHGDTLAMGLLKRIEFSALRVRILTPWLDPISVAGLAFGVTRIRPDGGELAPLRPGDL